MRISTSLKPFAPDGGLQLRAQLERSGTRLWIRWEADPAADLKIPFPSSEAGRKDELWKHTCFEAFFGVPGEPGYWELNISPSGSWNLYAFDGYREGMREESRISRPVAITPRRTGTGFELTAELDLGPLIGTASELEVALTAVIERKDGARGYWALSHEGAQPDFHLRASFQLLLLKNS